MKIFVGILLFALALTSSYGFIRPDRRGRIVGGVAITINQAPYQAAVLIGGYLCGGSIISANYILTAAHCAYGFSASSATVRVGSIYYSSGGQTFQVNTITVHPNYDQINTNYDFALLKLKTNITLDGTTKSAIALPAANELIADNIDVYVSGFGTTSSGGSLPTSLRAVTVKTVNQATCNSKYAGGITSQMVCAALPGKDSCQGDSGGPLKAINSNKLIGVVSWGNGCADPYYPGVYARVASVRPWITSTSGV